MLRPSILIALSFALATSPEASATSASPGTVAAATDAEDDFRAGFARVRQLCQSGRWSTAADQLDRLLAEHERAPYVTPHAAEIVELFERCEFFVAQAEDDLRQLSRHVEGELLSWDRASGRIALRYDELPGDFEREGELLFHPVELTGPYRVEVRGTLPPASGSALVPPQILVCIEGAANYQVVFGHPRFEGDERARWIPARILDNREGKSSLLDEEEATTLVAGGPYEIAVEVGPTRITAAVGGRELLSAEKPRGRFGRVALLTCPDVTRVTLSGVANPAWLEGLADAAREREREAFLAGWDPRQRVPAWLLELVPDAPPPGRATGTISFSRSVSRQGLATLEELSELQASGRSSEGLALLAELEPGALPAELALFFAALFSSDLELLGPALESIDGALEVDPEFVEASALRVRILAQRHEGARARAAVADLLSTDPDSVFAWAECARTLLRLGEPDEAKTVTERALRRGVPAEVLADVTGVLVRALEGPTWERVYEYRSAHYEVRSDVGRQVCFDAANALEESLLYYRRRLGRLGSHDRGTRRRVYVFAGKSGYDGYAADLFDQAPDSTAGLYSPLLKQLLVWSQPDREDTLSTLRHEGLHQYLDGLVRRPPPWFDEGLAEYFEIVSRERGAVVEGAPQEHHVAHLTAPGAAWVPYRSLLAYPHSAFYADAAQHYAQSWALVHWLLSGGLAEQRMFQRLLDDLAAGDDPDDVRERLLSFGDLDAEVRAHLERLARDV